MNTKKRRFYTPRKRQRKFDLRAVLRSTPVKQGAIATFLLALQATLIACSSSGSVSVDCFLQPHLDECESVAESISDSLPGGAAIAVEQPQSILDLCSGKIRNPSASLTKEQWAWVVANDGSITNAQLLENVGEPLCKADGDNGIAVDMEDGTVVHAPRYLYPLSFGQDGEYGDVVIDPNTYQPMGIPGVGVIEP